MVNMLTLIHREVHSVPVLAYCKLQHVFKACVFNQVLLVHTVLVCLAEKRLQVVHMAHGVTYCIFAFFFSQINKFVWMFYSENYT